MFFFNYFSNIVKSTRLSISAVSIRYSPLLKLMVILFHILFRFIKIDDYFISRFILNLIGWKRCHAVAMCMAM